MSSLGDLVEKHNAPGPAIRLSQQSCIILENLVFGRWQVTLKKCNIRSDNASMMGDDIEECFRGHWIRSSLDRMELR